MSRITVDKSLCIQDGACVEVCGPHALALDQDGFPEDVPNSSCILCGHCVAVCSCNALTHAGLPEEDLLPAAQELPAPALIDGFLMSRRSVREFKDEPVGREVLEVLLDVTRRAPTATNSQTLHWIVVDGKEKVHELSRETMRAPLPAGFNAEYHAANLKLWESGYDVVLRGAPTLVVACTPKDYMWGKEDCAIALTFLELAAEARGLGACWAGFLTRIAATHDPLRQMLSVPDGYIVCGGLMLGKGKYPYPRIPPRKPLSVQWN
jgi:nitroreductase/NAD-dependent dihydropyrimidine dehydrogenase PreA subunit